MELKLVDALNQVLSEPQKNYRDSQQALSKKLNRIKIPRTIIEEFQPHLKNILQTFDEIRKNSVKDFELALSEVKSSAAQFQTFFEDQFIVFAESLRCYVDGTIDDKKIKNFYDKTATGVFFSQRTILFPHLNINSSLNAEQIDDGLKFLQSKKLKRLNDKNSCEKSFVEYFGGEYTLVLDAENLKTGV